MPQDMCTVIDLGTNVSYEQALTIQEKLITLRSKQQIPDTLLLLEHQPVITLGTGTQKHGTTEQDFFNVSRETIRKHGVALHETDRGGTVTYHGPGQLVGYPIIDVTQRMNYEKAHEHFTKQLGDVLVAVCNLHGVSTYSDQGVYLQNNKEGKIGAVGVRFIAINKKHISKHGFAFDVLTDVTLFNKLIKPCAGDISAVSLQQFVRTPLTMNVIKQQVMKAFAQQFSYILQEQPLDSVI